MNTNCEACARGPSKVDGHAALMVHSLGVAGMLFKCRRCELTWMRSYSSEGRYDWTRLSDRIGAPACVGIVMPACGAIPEPVAAVPDVGGEAMDRWLAIQRGWKQPARRPH